MAVAATSQRAAQCEHFYWHWREECCCCIPVLLPEFWKASQIEGAGRPVRAGLGAYLGSNKPREWARNLVVVGASCWHCAWCPSSLQLGSGLSHCGSVEIAHEIASADFL